MRWSALVLTLLLIPIVAFASWSSSCRVTVVVDGVERPEYFANGTTYIEALRGRNYTLRLTNPTPHRVAVALAVDGLNTINAKHTDGWRAAKWVIDPYDSIDIDGWQVSDSAARRFVFTGERRSYGAALGKTENLGVIEAIFYRERQRQAHVPEGLYRRGPSSLPPSASPEASAEAGAERSKPQLDDDYAATGMGGRKRHDIETIHLDLDPTPIASARLRYEFRPQLVKLGVFPRERPSPTPLERRERARGFEYCPEPN